ncbi:Domain of uncharacterised function (DU1801) [Pragia fontium]|uniref:DUF1801 domain-containing protein n=1 Tax=Pragia fontium TaxID=82985 RepID=UPI00064A97C2|nr:DUF1801 domain-containing protein [Pragia fontium]AKJ42330.1 hypothetical protein QQ39_09745 [Pragia fontium]SUB82619.1 Domain of uncharacterised function (DU1801) [Pragia fontium]
MKDFQRNDVQAVFDAYPEKYRRPLLAIRDLIFDVASKTEGVGRITETLKWSQPSYLTQETGSGTTIRLDRFGESHIAFFVHCQTTLVDSFRGLFQDLDYSNNRAIIFDPEADLPMDELAICIAMSLTYKLNKKN